MTPGLLKDPMGGEWGVLLLCFPDLLLPCSGAHTALSWTAPVTLLSSGDPSAPRLPGPEAQQSPELEWLLVLPWKGGTPSPSRSAHHWKWDLDHSQGEEAFSSAKQINK